MSARTGSRATIHRSGTSPGTEKAPENSLSYLCLVAAREAPPGAARAALRGATQLLPPSSAGAEPCAPPPAPHPVHGPYRLD